MAKQINIEYVTITVPKTIEVDGVQYPRTERNIEIVREYESTKDESVLDKLSTIVLDFG